MPASDAALVARMSPPYVGAGVDVRRRWWCYLSCVVGVVIGAVAGAAAVDVATAVLGVVASWDRCSRESGFCYFLRCLVSSTVKLLSSNCSVCSTPLNTRRKPCPPPAVGESPTVFAGPSERSATSRVTPWER